MKKFFTRTIYLLLIIGVGVFAYTQYQNWQGRIDLAEQQASPQGQLPQWLTPKHYHLELRVNPDEERFSGQVKIQVALSQASQELWLHGQDLSASKAEFIGADGNVVALDYHEMGHSGVVRLSAAQPIAAQQGSININFTGNMAKDLTGLYLVKEGDENYAFTQFESIFARFAFPSFDEPRFKTPFDITLEVKNQHKGLANTPQIQHQQLDDGFQRLTFQTTKPLPTYLVAIAVGDLDVVEYAAIPKSAVRDREIPLRGIATKGKGAQMNYALENTAAILDALERYFDMPYPYEKLDLVAVPDFAAGAMENAGLITYREQLLLLGDNPSIDEIRSYASTHAHELAHQWFGNLVTMPWWNDIWLNESFATWMADITMNEWNPALGFERAMVRSGHRVMASDIYLDTRQIREPITDNGEIKNAFDGITYQKGGAVLQMMEDFVGEEAFRDGVRYHMKKYAFGHADALQFIESIERFAQKAKIKPAFESFLNQKGVPLVSLDYQCSELGNTVTLKQSRYLPLGARSSSEQQWTLPVCMTLINDEQQQQACFLLDKAQHEMTLESDFCPTAVMPNAGGKGYYRWSMAKDKQQRLIANLDKFSGAEKYSIASNLAAEYRAGRMEISDYLQNIRPLVADKDWDLISQPISEIKFIANEIANEQENQQISEFLSTLYQPKLDNLGLHPTSELDKSNPVEAKMLRKQMINLLALTLKQPEALNELADMGVQLIGYQSDSQLRVDSIEPELILPALSSAVEVHGKPFADAMVAQLENTDDGTLRQQILTAVGRSTHPEIGEMVLDMMTSLSLRVNERITLLVSQMSVKQNRGRVYQWFKENFSLMSMVIPKKYMGMTPLIGAGFCSEAMHQDVKTFFTEELAEIEGAERHLSTTLEKISMCVTLAKAKGNITI
ncbi:M1 family metallopeptidase [uncultured Paraglaciecola sp.]|uniref:M1 family metallopeptidase n=1 Tax=uncultured Paraglaciecola sp. TaxID=1765024 RepID=UPI00263060EB|nr:M1 family metallopeptidase [uncultured Paraglaciecola sp.]